MVYIPVSRQAAQSLKMLGGWGFRPLRQTTRVLAATAFLSALGSSLPLNLPLSDLAAGPFSPTPLYAEQSSGEEQSPGKAIYPVWKLLTRDQKMQFVAGYVQGWKDASKVTDIAIGFVRENPSQAVSGLERLKSLYDLSEVSPSLITSQLDTFFSKAENQSASLSYAISASSSVSR
jgi:hypothetical protein